MLVDLTVNKEVVDKLVKLIEESEDKELRRYKSPEKRYLIINSDPKNHIEKGIYRSIGFNFCIEEFIEFKNKSNLYKSQYWFDKDTMVCSYGVADSIDQIKEYYKAQIEDEVNKYVISLSYVFQEVKNKGRGGGWRWHKWGPYIGKLDHKCEYLDDEEFGPDFQGYVICFNCYKL